MRKEAPPQGRRELLPEATGGDEEGVEQVHDHLPLIPAQFEGECEVEVGAANEVAIVDPGGAALLVQECRHLQHLLGGGEAAGAVGGRDSRQQRGLDVADAPVEVGKDGVVGEVEVGIVGDGEGAAASKVEGPASGGIGQEAVEVAVDASDEAADGGEVEAVVGEERERRGQGGGGGHWRVEIEVRRVGG